MGLLEVRETRPRTARARIDWWGNVTFAVGLSAILVASTYGIQAYGGHVMGWTNPWVLAGLIGGTLLLVVFVLIERRVKSPMVTSHCSGSVPSPPGTSPASPWRWPAAACSS